MVEIKEEELEEEKLESSEAVENKQTPMEVTQEVVKMQQEKEQQVQSKEEVKEQPKPKPARSEIDLTHFNAFKDKVIKDFNLTCKVDSANHHCLYYKKYLVAKLLPRKKWRFGIWREYTEDGTNWLTKAFRVRKQEEEQEHYDYIKNFIEVNSKED